MTHAIRVAAAIAALSLAGTAHAGLFQPAEVTVDLTIGLAVGDTQTARLDLSEETFIGCGTRTFSQDDATFENGFCQANDGDGNQVTCFTQDPILLDAIGRLDDTSFITFRFTENEDAPDSFTCNFVGSSTQSFYLRPSKEEQRVSRRQQRRDARDADMDMDE